MPSLLSRILRPLLAWSALLALIAAGVGAASAGVARAAPASVGAAQTAADATCRPVDTVVLIDQSDSMRLVNDQDGKRFDAAQTIVDYLGNHAIWLCRDQTVTHRVAVIGFGDYPVQTPGSGVDNPYQEDVETYLTSQNVPPAHDFQAWREDRLTIRAPIDAAKSGQLGATDPYSGLLAARDQLAAWRAEPLDDQPRRQSVIIITDGEPCLFARSCGQVPIYNIDPDMTALEELTDPLDATFPWVGSDNPNSVHISLIAMSQRGGSMQDRFFDGWHAITQSHGGNVYSANDVNTNLNTIVTDILSPVSGSGMQAVACNTDVWVNPYTDNLVLIYAFGLNETDLGQAIINIDTGREQIQVVGGVATSDAVRIQEYIPDGRNEYYVFQPPVPGRYNITYSGADPTNCQSLMDIRAQRKPVVGDVVTPNERSSFPATTPPSEIVAEKFRVELFETAAAGERRPLVEFPDYPIAVTASVGGPGGHSREYVFQKVEDGVYESTELIQSPAVGEYNWALRATVETPNPAEPEIVVLEADGRFTATEVTPFGFAITRPAAGQTLPLNDVDGPRQSPIAIPVAIELRDAAGAPADIDTYLTDEAGLFTASLLRGDDVVESVPLTRVPGSASEFAGELTNSQAGQIVAAGDYTIEVTADWTPQRYNALLHAPTTASEAVAIRQFEVTPLDLMITSPLSATLHQANWWASAQGKLQPYEFHMQIINAVSGETMALPDVLADPEATFEAAVVPPSGDASFFTLEPLDNGQLRAAGAGLDVAEAGAYQVKIDTAAIPLQDGFAWAAPERTIDFSRQDTTWTNPLTWRVILGTIIGLLALIIGYLIYLAIGGPTGKLSVVEYRRGQPVPVDGGGPWSLRGNPRTIKIRNDWLKQNQIKVMKVKKTKPTDDEAARAVHVRALDAKGGLVYEGTLNAGESDAFIEGDIHYEV